jgi:ABC-type transport system substrate-binding protein
VFHLAGAYWEIAFKQVLCGQWSSIVNKDWCVNTADDWDGTEVDVVNYLHPQNNGDTKLYELTNGTGPYELDTWEHGVQIIVTKFANYHGAEQPFNDVTYKVVEEWTTRKAALLAGDCDLAYVPATNFDEMDSEPEGDLNVYYDLPSLSIDAFFFNMLIGGPQE